MKMTGLIHRNQKLPGAIFICSAGRHSSPEGKRSGDGRYDFLQYCDKLFHSHSNAHADSDSLPAGPRPIVIEEFTATWCEYCYGAGMALDEIEANYSRRQIIVLSYHDDDGFDIPFNYPRMTYYNILGIPTSWFDGITDSEGGASIDEGADGINGIYNNYLEEIQTEEQRIANVNPFTLSLSGKSR